MIQASHSKCSSITVPNKNTVGGVPKPKSPEDKPGGDEQSHLTDPAKDAGRSYPDLIIEY
jgi:hypothetical protein